MKLAALLLMASSIAQAAPLSTRVLDDFRGGWEPMHSEDVQATLTRDEHGGTCLHYDFGKVSGYAGLRRAMPLDFPANYAFRLVMHGQAPDNAFQVKWLDASGGNVWWLNRPSFTPPAEPTELLIRKRQVDFAWGPTTDKALKSTASMEIVVASGATGGKGDLCFDRLTMDTLAVPGPPLPGIAQASSNGAQASAALDDNPNTAWQAQGRGPHRWQVDLREPRELNGLMLRFPPDRRPSDIEVRFSDDGRKWRTVQEVHGNARALLPLWLPDSETRHLQLVMRATGPIGLAELGLATPQQWPVKNAMLQALAAASPAGRFPRGFVGQQLYWTLVGVDGGGARSALLSEDGAIEPRKGGPSLEPFVSVDDGPPVGWSEVQATHSLRDGYLPLPSVQWQHRDFALTMDTGAEGTRDDARLLANYTLKNIGDKRRKLTLALALRPWQVNPPTQFLNTPGGVTPVRSVAWYGRSLGVDGQPWLVPLQSPATVDVQGFARGDPLDAGGEPSDAVEDPQAMAGAALRWTLDLAPGESRSIGIELPLTATPSPNDGRSAGERLDAIAAAWRTRLNRVTLDVPPEAQRLADTLRSAQAQILMSRDGPALQPGTRSYARSWIRDGAMMSAGLLRLGEVEPVREYALWYGPHLFANGKVPCCVDSRGSDPVVENDSHGEFIHTVAELWRHTHDPALVATLWPQVDAAARYMEGLRQSERTADNRQPGREAWFGLMPKSISHEGYSAAPMHAYWDDFWALAGYRDAAMLAGVMKQPERAAELKRQHAEFERELAESLVTAAAQHKVDYLPGAAELGDFDPTSSTMIFSPAGAETRVPEALLEGTWNRNWAEFTARRDGTRNWNDYTPYELRSVGAYARLGQPERAQALLDFYFRDQRPAGWNQWAEVVGRDARQPRFVGDMPHAWISSDYIRSVLDLFAMTRESDQALVIGAGIPPAWLAHGVALRGLSTPYGKLGFRLKQEDGKIALALDPGLQPPPGGIRLRWNGQEHRLPEGARTLTLPLEGSR